MAENWQSEFLQFWLYLTATVWLLQKGSPESKELDKSGTESDAEQKVGNHARKSSPAWARAGGIKTAIYSNSLIIVMALSFALLPWLVFYRKHKPFVAHAVFSLHLYSFLLLLLSLVDVVPMLSRWPGSPPLLWRVVDNSLAVALLIACGVYLQVATKRVYAADGVARVAQVLVLTVGVGACVLGYRFALFLLTLYTNA